jgi:hypothetical protein
LKGEGRHNARLSALQQEKQILDSAGRDYQERNRQLQTSETDLRKQLQRKTQDLDGIVRSIRAAGTELGLNAPPATPPEELLQRLSRSYLQMSAGNNAYQARVKQLEGSLAKSQEEARPRTPSWANRLSRGSAQQIQIITTKDKALAQQMLQLQCEKSIVQSKLSPEPAASRWTASVTRNSHPHRNPAPEELDLGSIVVTAPLVVDHRAHPVHPENRLKRPGSSRLSDPTWPCS